MNHTVSSNFLRRALALDAIATGGTALLLIVGAEILSDYVGLPGGLMRGAGLVLVPFVGLVVWTAPRNPSPTGFVRLIILCNAAWVLASIVLLISRWVDPSALGYVFVLAQALVVGIFAELQFMGLRKAVAR